MTITQYEETHLPGILALCEAEGWPSLPADDSMTDTAEDFYASFEHRTFSGFRIYPF